MRVRASRRSVSSCDSPGPLRADAAAQPLEVLPHAAHALEVVLQLRELDLQLAGGRMRVQREDVEDHAGAVDDAHAELVLERALLAGRELVLGHDDLGLQLLRELLELLELAAADVRARVDARAVLHERPDDVDLRRAQQLEHLRELALLVGPLREHGNENGALRPCVVLDHLRSLGHDRSIRTVSHNRAWASGPGGRAVCAQRARAMRSTASASRSSGAVSDRRT